MNEKILTRTTFETSRELEYFSEKELRAQIGHDKSFWPIVLLRELIDNSLDACEKSGIAPVIEVTTDKDSLTVQDNGSGIPIDIIKRSQDYMYRISDKAYYISPTRGQMGNALKVVYAVPFVLSPDNPGFVEIGSVGELHHISVTMDRIMGKPVMKDTVTGFVRNGTFVKIYSSSLLAHLDSDKHYNWSELIEGYMAFNPHVTFILNGKRYEATDPAWEKWTTDRPTSAHWYNTETISELVRGYLAKERMNGQHKKSVREFVSEFAGLSGTAKQKKVTEDFYRADLSMFEKDGNIDRESLSRLLQKMQAECSAPKPKTLGIIGKEHITKWILGQGGAEPSISYINKHGIDNDGMPYVFEFGFAVKTDSTLNRTQLSGLNWSPCVGDVPDPTLRQAIQEASINPRDPVIFVAHIAKPRFEFMDRGKTKIEL
jgi:DNA topoisomerase VI subunit B